MSDKVDKVLDHLSSMEGNASLQSPGWDSYGAAPLDLCLLTEVRLWVHANRELLEALPCKSMAAFPTPQGGILIEDMGKLGDPFSFYLEWTPETKEGQ